MIPKDNQLFKFCAYGFLKNQRFFDVFILLFFLAQGISYFQIGILISIREISLIIFEIPTGFIADSFGRRRSMIFAFLSYIISFLIFYIFPYFYFYIPAMILFALGEAFRSGTHKAMIFRYLELNNIQHLKVEYYGYTRSWSQIGSALAALIAGAIVFFSGEYRYIFLGSTIPYILALLLMITYPKELDCVKYHSEGLLKNIFNKFKELFKDFYLSFREPQLRKAVINSALFDGLFKTIKDYLQPILQVFIITLPFFGGIKQRDSILIAIVYCILYILTAIASRNSKKFRSLFSKLFQAVNISYLFGIFIVLLSGIFLNIKLDWVVIFLFIMLFVFQNIRRPINVAFISENLSQNIMASGLSVESQLKTLVIAFLSPIMGYIADNINIGSGLIILSSLTLIVFPVIKLRGK